MIREISEEFEAKKIGMAQNAKEGHILKLAIHPDNIPEDVFRDPVGTVYMVVLVRLDIDSNQPVASKNKEEGNQAIKALMAMCRNTAFRNFLLDKNIIEHENYTAEELADVIKDKIGIESREALKESSAARQRLFALREDFMRWHRMVTRLG